VDLRYLYTAIFGGSDRIRPPGPIPAGWRAVCFTDSGASGAGGWELRAPMLGSETSPRSARAHKLLPHRLFPDAEVSLWIDGNISVHCDLDRVVEGYLHDADLALHRHRDRDCVYEEGAMCIELGKDDEERIGSQLRGYERRGHPRHAGLYATGVLLRRHTEAVRRLGERWWAEVEAGSHRDQLSAPVAIAAIGLPVATFDSDYRDGPLFRRRRHDGPAAPGRQRSARSIAANGGAE